MDNVKDFINKFVLSEEKVDVAALRENIETLSELEGILARSKKQLDALQQILDKYEAIEAKDRAIRVNEILLQIANRDALETEAEELGREIRLKVQTVESNREMMETVSEKLWMVGDQILAIHVDKQTNASGRMVEQAEEQIRTLNAGIAKKEDDEKKLQEQLGVLGEYLRSLAQLAYQPLRRQEAELLGREADRNEKAAIIEKLEAFQETQYKEIQAEWARLGEDMRRLSEAIDACQQRLKNLEKRLLPYPEYAARLKAAVEHEFKKRGIASPVYFLSELLEIEDIKWSNAVEGYLHTQKFYLVVEPEYYDVALEVYDRNRRNIHTAGIINSKKLPTAKETDHQSLAYVVKSENRYAKAYVNYILGRVTRCESVRELENFPIAITPECMLYQGYVVRHINPRDYENPFIGQNAYLVHIGNVKKEIEEKTGQRKELREKITTYSNAIESARKVNVELIKLYLYAPELIRDMKEQLVQAKAELKAASDDPTLIELNLKLEEKEVERKALDEEFKRLEKENYRLEIQVGNAEGAVQEKKAQCYSLLQSLEAQADADGIVFKEAEAKYLQNRKSKTARTIAENFAPQRAQFINEREELLNGNRGLKTLQMQFNHDFTLDFMTGTEGMTEYREALQKLKSVEIVRYEEKLKSAKDDCEQIFRSDFLSKMKEHIEAARNEFRSLNKALDSIYYGDDSYRFKITFDKNKEGLYKMITSENNQEGMNLWTSAFEAEYREEMSDLFDKLMTRDDHGQKIVEEYTDYRSYLDYDIEIHKRDGSMQRFSDIYGEKSGSETQVPYYVAIAASFYQLYRYGNSVRVMLLDEAFDKMDDERIQSMMDFFNSLGLQVLLATPPAKIEVIGEKVGTILTAIRVVQNSIVEEYDL